MTSLEKKKAALKKENTARQNIRQDDAFTSRGTHMRADRFDLKKNIVFQHSTVVTCSGQVPVRYECSISLVTGDALWMLGEQALGNVGEGLMQSEESRVSRKRALLQDGADTTRDTGDALRNSIQVTTTSP